jgi:hypothetical protein
LLAAVYADTLPQEGHSYKMVNGQLVEVMATVPPIASNAASPASGTQPTIIINNNNIVAPPQAAPVPILATLPSIQTVVPEPVPTSNAWDFIVAVEKDLNNHNWSGLTPFLADGHVNYFGRRYTSVSYVVRDMQNDAYNYPYSDAKYYADSFTHQVSSEYSPHWSGPMIYDEINVYSVVTERGGRVHRAMTRLTVGYTNNDGNLRIYALVLKVI